MPSVPCPPGSPAVVKSSDENCTLLWNAVPYADSYKAFINEGDGSEVTCTTASSNCTYRCQCGCTYLMSVVAYNKAGSSPKGKVLNYTTGEKQKDLSGSFTLRLMRVSRVFQYPAVQKVFLWPP